MVVNIILALCIPLSLAAMGFFMVKILNSLLDYAIKNQEYEKEMMKEEVKREEINEEKPTLTEDVLKEYLFGEREV